MITMQHTLRELPRMGLLSMVTLRIVMLHMVMLHMATLRMVKQQGKLSKQKQQGMLSRQRAAPQQLLQVLQLLEPQ